MTSDIIASANRQVELLEALPAESLVRDGDGGVWRKLASGEWRCLDSPDDNPSETSATVVWQSTSPRTTILWSEI